MFHCQFRAWNSKSNDSFIANKRSGRGMVRQWDIVMVRINAADSVAHPAVILSRDEVCTDERRKRVNVLYGSTHRPAETIPTLAVRLNGADGLHGTLFDCSHVYTVEKAKFIETAGRVSRERRKQIGRKILQAYRLPISQKKAPSRFGDGADNFRAYSRGSRARPLRSRTSACPGSSAGDRRPLG